MAINPITRYPGRVTAADASYPYGSAKAASSAGALDGTPRDLAFLNDDLGFKQAILSRAGYVPTGTPDNAVSSQYLSALDALFTARVHRQLFAGADTYTLHEQTKAVMLLVVGGGGGGGGGAELVGGGGGGSGGVDCKWFWDLGTGDLSIVVGSGGTSGNAGGASSISFASVPLVAAAGGLAGGNGSGVVGGAGGRGMSGGGGGGSTGADVGVGGAGVRCPGMTSAAYGYGGGGGSDIVSPWAYVSNGTGGSAGDGTLPATGGFGWGGGGGGGGSNERGGGGAAGYADNGAPAGGSATANAFPGGTGARGYAMIIEIM